MSLISMTGYGSSRINQDSLEVVVEIKTVNSRYLDLSLRLPQIYSSLEQPLSKIIKEKIARGRVDVFVTRKALSDESFEVRFSEKLYKDFFDTVTKKSKELKLKDDALTLELFKLALSRKEILEIANSSHELSNEENALVEKALTVSLQAVIEMRKVEGKALEKVILTFVSDLEAQLQNIKSSSQKFSEQALDKIKAKLDKYKKEINIESERVAQELAILFDRTDIAEEISRLESHFVQFKKIIAQNEGGKKIEFLLQEFGREFNTIGSKSQSSEISQYVIEAKSILEKIREQAANIE